MYLLILWFMHIKKSVFQHTLFFYPQYIIDCNFKYLQPAWMRLRKFNFIWLLWTTTRYHFLTFEIHIQKHQYLRNINFMTKFDGHTTVHSVINQNATVTSQLPTGIVWLTTKHYKIFPIRVKYHSIKTNQFTFVLRGAENDVPVTVAFQFISEHTIYK
jgi:hypothetical protein